MRFEELKNKHQGSKIIVCGCGESALQLKDKELNGAIIIGVNDFSRLRTPDYLVVVNDKPSFNSNDRWHWIENTQCPYVFTHIERLAIPDEKKVIFQLGRYGGTVLDKPTVDYTNNSPYVGVLIAYHLGAIKIGLIGVDFTPNHFFAQTGDHVLNARSAQISKEYQQLHGALLAKGVGFYNLSAESKIDIPKMSADEFINSVE
jgi:hypothetical protein